MKFIGKISTRYDVLSYPFNKPFVLPEEKKAIYQAHEQLCGLKELAEINVIGVKFTVR